MIESGLGTGAIADFESMQTGKLVVPPSDYLRSEGLKLIRIDQQTFDLGFDYSSMIELKIKGLVPGSRAALSGLKEGEAATPAWQVADVFEQNTVVRVRKGQDLIDYTFWPRSWKKVEAYQWALAD